MAALYVQPGSWRVVAVHAITLHLVCESMATQMQQYVVNNQSTCLMMTWWQMYVGHATSQLLAQLSWQGLKCLQHKAYYV